LLQVGNGSQDLLPCDGDIEVARAGQPHRAREIDRDNDLPRNERRSEFLKDRRRLRRPYSGRGSGRFGERLGQLAAADLPIILPFLSHGGRGCRFGA
jgi:hypothetical protein